MTADASPPEGYQPHDRHSPLTRPWEPLYSKRTERAVQIAVEIREPHLNSRGLVHGGLISALADNAMGLSAIASTIADGGTPQRALTVSLSLDFVDAGRPGEWLEIVPVVVRAGHTLAFVECRVVVGERMIARGNATFKMG